MGLVLQRLNKIKGDKDQVVQRSTKAELKAKRAEERANVRPNRSRRRKSRVRIVRVKISTLMGMKE